MLPKMSQQCKKSDGMSVKTNSNFVHRELSFSLVAMTMTMEAATDDSVFHKSQNYKQIFNCKKGPYFSQLIVIFGKRGEKWEFDIQLQKMGPILVSWL